MYGSINSLKEMALQILTTEAFRYINQVAYQDYLELARQNSIIRGVTASFFTYDGVIYPDKTKSGESVRLVNVVAPALHYSLYEGFDAVVNRTNDAGIVDVCNYFRAVLSYSINGIVLDELLPAILVNAIKGEFTEDEYSLINDGVSDVQSRWEDVASTRQNIEDIKTHYAHTITVLREQLMNKLLLESR